jgi:hypothetical protein
VCEIQVVSEVVEDVKTFAPRNHGIRANLLKMFSESEFSLHFFPGNNGTPQKFPLPSIRRFALGKV